jgi:hypothetical protein
MSMKRGRGHDLTFVWSLVGMITLMLLSRQVRLDQRKRVQGNHNVGAIRTSTGSATLPSACDPARVANKEVQCRR